MAAAVGLLVSAGAGIFGMVQQNKAIKAQEKAAREQRALQRGADARERRRMLREQAIASGQTVNVAAQVGAGQGPTASTALTGGLSGLQNQVLSATAFQGMTAESMKRQQAALNQAAKYQQSASIAAGIGSLGSSIGDFASGLQRTNFRFPSFGQVV
jgi:hypothetical protein